MQIGIRMGCEPPSNPYLFTANPPANLPANPPTNPLPTPVFEPPLIPPEAGRAALGAAPAIERVTRHPVWFLSGSAAQPARSHLGGTGSPVNGRPLSSPSTLEPHHRLPYEAGEAL